MLWFVMVLHVLNAEQSDRHIRLPEQAAALGSLKRELYTCWARREECEVFFCEEMSQVILFPDFLTGHAPFILLSRQTSNHSVDTRSCSVQLSFKNRVTARLSKRERGIIWKKNPYGTAYFLRKHLTAFPGVQPHYGWSTVHNHLLKALFLPDLVSLSIKVTEYKWRYLISSHRIASHRIISAHLSLVLW